MWGGGMNRCSEGKQCVDLQPRIRVYCCGGKEHGDYDVKFPQQESSQLQYPAVQHADTLLSQGCSATITSQCHRIWNFVSHL